MKQLVEQQSSRIENPNGKKAASMDMDHDKGTGKSGATATTGGGAVGAGTSGVRAGAESTGVTGSLKCHSNAKL